MDARDRQRPAWAGLTGNIIWDIFKKAVEPWMSV